MMPLRAGTAYFAIVFAIAFVVGAFRVMVVVPRVGELIAVTLELPLILIVSWYASRWTCTRFAVPADTASRIHVGAIAFALLMSAEVALAVVAFGRPVDEYLLSFTTRAGALGLAGQVMFALLPWLQSGRR